jgi:hypothetical protein
LLDERLVGVIRKKAAAGSGLPVCERMRVAGEV